MRRLKTERKVPGAVVAKLSLFPLERGGEAGDDETPITIPWEPEAVEAALRIVNAIPDRNRPHLTLKQIDEHADDLGTFIKAAWAHPRWEIEAEGGRAVLEELREALGGLLYQVIMRALIALVYLVLPFDGVAERAGELGNQPEPSAEPS